MRSKDGQTGKHCLLNGRVMGNVSKLTRLLTMAALVVAVSGWVFAEQQEWGDSMNSRPVIAAIDDCELVIAGWRRSCGEALVIGFSSIDQFLGWVKTELSRSNWSA